MAIYIPKVWTNGVDVLDKTNLDHLESQYDAAIKPVPKTADETVNNSTVLQNDDDLLFGISAAGTWQFTIRILMHGAAAAGIKFAIVVPAGASLCWAAQYSVPAAAVMRSSPPVLVSGTALALTTSGAGEANGDLLVIHGWVKAGGTAGNVQLQWAQAAAQVSDTIVMEESNLIAHPLA